MPFRAWTDEIYVKHGDPFSLGDEDVLIEVAPHHIQEGTVIVRILRREVVSREELS